MKNTTIYLIRHVESLPSKELPEKEWDITEKGKKNASELVNMFDNISIEAIYSSPYKRAIKTITPLSEHNFLQINIRENLKERILSQQILDIQTARSFIKQSWIDFNFKLIDGESNNEAQKRIVREMNLIANRHINHTIVISSHGNLIGVFLKSIDSSFNYNCWKNMKNPSIYKIIYTNGCFFY